MNTILSFLNNLKNHNDRDWFQKNKTDYDKAKKEFETFINDLIPAIAKFDETVKFVNAKESIFRIFRDVRFSNDKSPFKTNFGAWIGKGGRKHSGPGYYVHIQPGESFIAAGVYMPDGPTLKKIRQEIFYNIDEFKSILNEKKMKKIFNGLDDFDKGKLAPQGFPKDFPDIDILKNKHFVVTAMMSDDEVGGKDYLKKVVNSFETVVPFQNFLRRAVE